MPGNDKILQLVLLTTIDHPIPPHVIPVTSRTHYQMSRTTQTKVSVVLSLCSIQSDSRTSKSRRSCCTRVGLQNCYGCGTPSRKAASLHSPVTVRDLWQCNQTALDNPRQPFEDNQYVLDSLETKPEYLRPPQGGLRRLRPFGTLSIRPQRGFE